MRDRVGALPVRAVEHITAAPVRPRTYQPDRRVPSRAGNVTLRAPAKPSVEALATDGCGAETLRPRMVGGEPAELDQPRLLGRQLQDLSARRRLLLLAEQERAAVCGSPLVIAATLDVSSPLVPLGRSRI